MNEWMNELFLVLDFDEQLNKMSSAAACTS